MQLVNFWIFASFLIASATSLPATTTQSEVTTPNNNTALTNATTPEVQLPKDQSHANPDITTVSPTRAPVSEMTTVPLVHRLETSSKQPVSMVPKANGTESAGKGSAKTDGNNGASRTTSGFLVISFIFLSLSIIYAVVTSVKYVLYQILIIFCWMFARIDSWGHSTEELQCNNTIPQ